MGQNSSSINAGGTEYLAYLIREVIQQQGSQNARLTRFISDNNKRLDKLEELIITNNYCQNNLPTSAQSTAFEFKKLETLLDCNNFLILLNDSDYENKIMNLLSKLGGTSLKDTVNRTMKFLFSQEVLSLFNMTGRRGKQKFEDKVVHLITNTSRMILPNIKNSEVEQEIYRVLHLATDAKNKARRKSNDEPKKRRIEMPGTSEEEN